MDVEQERLRLASEVAAPRLMGALARRELKYREDQARQPATGRGGVGGRFANEGGGGSRSPAFAPPLAAAARVAARAAPALAAAGAVETAIGLSAGAAGVAGGAAAVTIGASRAAGLAAVYSGAAGGMTPILGVPFKIDSPAAHVGASSSGRRPKITEQVRTQCYEAYDEDVSECYRSLGLKRRECLAQASERHADCLRKGGAGRTKIPLFPNG